jgi:uncharacterized protein YbjT (DUF2867 family)
MKSNILVIGGTGKTGRRVVEKLEQLNHPVRIGSRSSNPVFDWDDPGTYAEALKDMDKAYIVYSPDLAVPGAKEAIRALTIAAKKEGLSKVVLLSGKGEKEAELCEEIVARSGLDYTLVRASWFNQNFSESFFLEPILDGKVALPMPEMKIPFVDADDIADVVVKVLLNDKHNGETYELTGPRTMNFEEVVHEIAQVSGRDIKYEAISIEQYISLMKEAGLPSNYIWLFKYLFKEVLGNEKNHYISSDVEKLLGRKATDFSEFAHKTAASGIWNPVISHV